MQQQTFLYVDEARADRKDGLRVGYPKIWIKAEFVIAVKVDREGVDNFIKRERSG